MKFKLLKYYVFCLCLAWGWFFGAGLVDRQRLKADKSPFFASGPIAIPKEDHFEGLIYEAALTYEVADMRKLAIGPPKPMRLPPHQEGGHLNFHWNYWTLLAASPFAFVVPHLFERIPKKIADALP